MFFLSQLIEVATLTNSNFINIVPTVLRLLWESQRIYWCRKALKSVLIGKVFQASQRDGRIILVLIEHTFYNLIYNILIRAMQMDLLK